ELREDPITVGADDSVIVSSTVLEVDGTERTAPVLFVLNGTDGQDLREIVLADENTESFNPVLLCAGENDDAHAWIGEFQGTLRSGNSVATVENRSIFVFKSSDADGAPVYLRWSASSVDVSTEFGSCDNAGGLVTGGRFTRVNAAAPEEEELLLYFLRLTT
ncbi:MAG: hypothetical protein AAFQ82_19500, partial [Myxococcota bacterium]